MTIEDRLRAWKIPVGMRTIKTTIAVILALLVVQPYGTSTAKVVFATIGAMSAVGPTFKASAVACLTQICSVTVGAVMAVIMAELKVPPMAAVGIGIIILLWMYQYSHLKLLPVLPCLVLVNICLTPEIEAAPYALGRLWDTAIGLGIGMLINTLVFPYDNSQKIRQTMVSLDSDLIEFLEDMFDGDEHQPEQAVDGACRLDADEADERGGIPRREEPLPPQRAGEDAQDADGGEKDDDEDVDGHGGQNWTLRVPSPSSPMVTRTASSGRRLSMSSGHSMKHSEPE